MVVILSSCSSLNFHNSCKLWLPFVTVLQKLRLIVEQLLVEECRVLEVGALHDSVDWASFLAEATKDAFSHVNIVFSGSSGTVWSWLGFDHDGESGASGFAEFAGNAPLLAGWVSSEGVLASEHGGKCSLLPRVVDDVVGLEARPGS